MNDDFNISRRKALAALGTIGAASAGAGLGTSAYFSDQETFTNNQLTAGTLDLKVSWEEHYSDWKGEETQYASMPTGDEVPDLVLPAPDGEGKDIELVFSDQSAFMDATIEEQFPEGGLGDQDPCEALADVPDDLTAPVIDLEDVKPGDFGEVTFDFSLCTNPGYLWLNGGLLSESEGEQTEPELEDPDEGPGVELADKLRARAWYDNGEGGNGTDGGNGLVSTSATLSATSVANSGDSATDLAESLVSPTGGVTVSNASLTGNAISAGTFSGGEDTVGIDSGVILSSGDVENVEGPNDTGSLSVDNGGGSDPDLAGIASGTVNDAAVLEFDFTIPADADQVFFNYVFGSEEYNEWVGSSFNDVFGFFLNGTNVATIDNPEVAGEDTVAINNINNGENAGLYVDNTAGGANTQMDGFTVVLQVGEDLPPGSTNTLKLAVGDVSDSNYDSWVMIEGGSLSTVPTTGGEGDNIKQPGEEIITEGSLREVLTELSTDRGIPLSGNIAAEDGGGVGRDCYSPAPTVHYVAFQWWLPIDHGNEVQGDTVEFDLGFYAEQCRHNDGAGMNDEVVNDS